MREIHDSYLREVEKVLGKMHGENLVLRQPSKAKRLAARMQVNSLENKYRKWEAELCEGRLITWSKSWCHGIDGKQIVELLREAFSIYINSGLGKIRDIVYRYGIAARIIRYRIVTKSIDTRKNTAELGLVLSRRPTALY